MYCLLNYYGLGLQMNLRWGYRVAQNTKSGLFTCLSHQSPVYILGLPQGKKAQSSTKGRIKQSNHQIKTAIMADRIMKEQNADISLEELGEAGSFLLIILTVLNSASSSSGVFLIEKSQGDLKNSNLGTSESFSIAWVISFHNCPQVSPLAWLTFPAVVLPVSWPGQGYPFWLTTLSTAILLPSAYSALRYWLSHFSLENSSLTFNPRLLPKLNSMFPTPLKFFTNKIYHSCTQYFISMFSHCINGLFSFWFLNGKMGGWMDGQMDVSMDGWMREWMSG